MGLFKHIRFAEWDESRHPREGGRFAPKEGAGESKKETSVPGIGSVTRDKTGTTIRVGWIARAAIETGFGSAIRAAGTALLASGAAETVTGAGAVVGVPSMASGLALHGIARLLGHYATEAVVSKIEEHAPKLAGEVVKGVVRKAGEQTTNLTIKHIAKHAKRISVDHSEQPFGGTRIHIAKQTEFREGAWNEAEHHRGTGGRFGSGTQAHGNPNRIPKIAGPVTPEKGRVHPSYEPSTGVTVAAGAIVAGGVGLLGYGAWQIGAALANRNSQLFRGLATLGKQMRFSEWDETKHARNHGKFAPKALPEDIDAAIAEHRGKLAAHKAVVREVRKALREVRKTAPKEDASLEELRDYAERKGAAILKAAQALHSSIAV